MILTPEFAEAFTKPYGYRGLEENPGQFVLRANGLRQVVLELFEDDTVVYLTVWHGQQLVWETEGPIEDTEFVEILEKCAML